jgi:hypothetical protein
MPGKNNQPEKFNTDSQSEGAYNEMANKGRGMQGIDKAPGEETAQSTNNITEISQKGKKVDADPSKPSGKPVKE